MNILPEKPSKVKSILGAGDNRKARGLREFGRISVLLFDAATSAGFGYYFVRLLATTATVAGASVSGIFGALVTCGMTAGLARIWNLTQLKASDSEQQHNIAKIAYIGTVIVSLFFTVAFLIVSIFGLSDYLGAQWLLFGRIVITAVAVLQLVAWLLFERYSPDYNRALIATVTAYEMESEVLEAEADIAEKAKEKAARNLDPYIDYVATQIAAKASRNVLDRLNYGDGSADSLPALPSSAETTSPAKPEPTPQPARRSLPARMRPRRRATADHITIYPNGHGNGGIATAPARVWTLTALLDYWEVTVEDVQTLLNRYGINSAETAYEMLNKHGDAAGYPIPDDMTRRQFVEIIADFLANGQGG